MHREAPPLMHRRAVAFLALLILSGACGTSARKQQAQRLAEADALFSRGCYVCLTKAFEAYDGLRLSGYQPAAMAARAFDTAVLIAAREKELAMPADPWMAKARALAVPGARSTLYLEMADALPWATGRHDRDFAHPGQAAARPPLDALARWDTALGPEASRDLTGTYLMASARCALTPARLHDALTMEALAPAHAATPLMRYATGSCRAGLRPQLDALSGDPDFHELLFQRGRLRLFEGGTTVHLDARVLLEAAREAMPAMLANTYLLAGVLNALEEYEACAERYAEVIARGGARREASLNRTVCLTHAGKRGDAIVTATSLIDTPGILRGEAYFWRAWNHYHEQRLPLARADVEAAKPLFDSADLYALSGFVAYDMGQKPYAHSEFGEAYQRSRGYCTAPFYRGIIDSDFDRWDAALREYLLAAGCYDASVRRLEEDLRQAERLDPDNPTRQRRIDNLTAAVDAERLQLARAAYNVAYAHGRMGNAASAIPFAEKAAATHKDMEKLATDLLAILRKAG